jgi:DNA helicase IV
MTILGDLAQATAPGAQSSWDDVVAALGSPATANVAELELGYRVPAPIIDVVNRLLPSVAPNVRASRSVRLEGRPPTVVAVPAAAAVGADRSAAALVAAVAEHAGALAAAWTSVGVVVPDDLLGPVGDALAAADAPFGSVRRPAGSDDVAITLLAPPEAKGLEFDAVVVAEPAAFLTDGADGTAGSTAGGRLLYIALTRAVQDLTIVHAAPLPPELGELD